MRDNDYKITLFCEFEDKETEKEYFSNAIAGTIKYMRPAVLLLGLLYMLFIIPDYFLVKNSFRFNLILLNRFIILIMFLVLYIRIRTIKDYNLLPYWVSFIEVISVISFLLVELMYNSPDYLIHALGVVIIIFVIFLVPNRWLFSTSVSVITGFLFFVLSYVCIKDLKPQHFLA
ncbi:MAG TPA: diguanylate cyclase, partial [Clostridia bacterium]|nr:diguanylate cyclase [Clostridia bacterium]